MISNRVYIIEEMAKRLNLSIKIKLYPWKRLIVMMKSGKCDGSFSLFQIKEREAFAFYAPSKPIHIKLLNNKKLQNFKGQITTLFKPIVPGKDAYFILSKKGKKIKDKVKMISMIDQTLESMEEDGVFIRIYNKYLNYNFKE